MNNKNIFKGFYCKKCNTIPLIEMIPDNKNTTIFFYCKCHKKSQSIDLFNRNYYQNNIELNKISSLKNNCNYNDIDFIKNKSEKETKIKDIIEEYNKTKKEFYKYSKDLKDYVINTLNSKIERIKNAYYNNLLINKKIENLINILIESYKKIDDNICNINNLINNSKFNKIPKNLNCSEDFALSFYEKEFIIKTPEQMKTVQRFNNHSRGVNCFIDYKINNEYYGVSSSYDSNIAFYDLNKNKHLFTFCADKNLVNWIIISFENNVISCGNDYYIKIWPLINSYKIMELNNYLENGRQINLSPLCQYKCKVIINKIEYIGNKNKNEKNDYLLGCSKTSIYLFKYKLFLDDIINNDQIDLIAEYNNDFTNNCIYIKTKINNNYNEFIFAFNLNKIMLLDYPKLKKIKENTKLKISLISMNNCVQINNNEILLIQYKLLTIINIIKLEKTFSIKMDGIVDCITKLKDGTIIQGGQKGIKRYLQYNFLEFPILNNGYNDEDYSGDYIDFDFDNEINELESILCIKELLDGRIVFCFQHKGINISKLNIL